MRIAALYDIHGNLPALEAAIVAMRASAPDLVVIGGDVLPGPMPSECLAALRELDLPARFITGNGDRAVLGERAGTPDPAVPAAVRDVMRWNAEQVSDEDAAFIGSWPSTTRAGVTGLGEVLFCHATPRSDTELFTRLTPVERVAPALAGVGEAVVVCGHTHMQFDRRIGDTRVVNAGSVGMPFGEPAACWLLLGPDVQLMRTPYDLAAAASRIRATAYPQRDAFADTNVMRPPGEQAMLEAYARIASG